MSIQFAPRLRAILATSIVFAGLTVTAAAIAAETPEVIRVNVDQAKIIPMPQKIATLVVGNPLIADVSLQSGGIVVITGKGYGATNVIATDRQGTVVADRLIQVDGPADRIVTIYRGVNRETYSCMPICQRRMTLGDSEAFFKSTVEQTGGLSTLMTNLSKGN